MIRPHRAFSLVEVTMAIGIASFALLVIFSVMPTGIAALRDTSKQIVETEIFDKIGSELSSMPLWSNYLKPASTNDDQLYYLWTQSTRFPAFFDSEGNEIAKPSGSQTVAAADLPRVVYTVRITPSTAQGATQWAPLGGNSSQSSAASWGQGELRWCAVSIGVNCDPNKAKTGNEVDVRTFMLSNNGVSPTPTP